MSGQYYTDHQIFYIDSNKRKTGTTSNFSIELILNNDIQYDRVVMLDFSCPKSYYIIPDGRNTFTLVQGLSTYAVTIPPANYTRTSLASVLQNMLNAASSFVYAVTYQKINVTGDNGLLKFTVTGNAGVQPQFIFSNNSPYEQLGFNIDTYSFTGDILNSVNVINLAQEPTLFISSDICQNKNDSILQNIFTSADSSFSFVNWHNSSPYEYSKNFSQSRSNIYSFTLTNENNEEINLNGLNMVFTIMVYKSNKIDNLMKAYIKYKTLQTNGILSA